MDPAELESVLARVDATLRGVFPDDFDRRCMYAAFGVHDLLVAGGHAAEVAAGDFLFLTVSRDQLLMEGFGTADLAGPPSHFWVEADGFRVDLGPHYLAHRTRLPGATAAPPLCWKRGTPLPHFARYRERERVQALAVDDAVAERLQRFRAACLEATAPAIGPPWAWLLRSPGSVTAAVRQGDLWAAGAQAYLKRSRLADLPF